MSLPVPVARVFAFFSDAANLPRITPPDFGLQITSPQPVLMQQGTIIDCKIRLLGFPVPWQSLISRWEPPHLFTDEQLRGPCKSWVHVHRFQELSAGTVIEDEVEYSLPWPQISELAHPLVRRQLRRIFHFRQEAIKGILCA